MKKILMVCEAFGGGVFTYVSQLCNDLCGEFDVYLAYALRPQTPENFADYFDEKIYLIEVKNLSREVNLIKDIKAFIEIKNIGKKIKPDIIHLHSSKAGVLGRWAFDGKKTAMFYTPHGYSFLMQDSNAMKKSAYRAIEAISAKRHCMTISCSEGEHRETLKLTKNATYVDNGIDIKEIQKILSETKPAESKNFTVCTVGRICFQKNPKLFNEIAEAMPDAHFLWIGDGEMRDELTAPNIEVTGWMERRDALLKCFSADAFVLTSLWEGLPISLLEAMYMKKPCAVSDVIGNHDVIRDGKNGYVCTGVSEYAEAIKSMKKGDAKEMTEIAYEEILSRYNTAVMAGKYSAIYEQTIEKMFGGGMS